MVSSYSKEFKEDAVSYVRSHPELSINKCAQQLGVNANTLHTWLSKYRAGKELHRGQGNYESDEAKEIARLKRELRNAQDALEILKKQSK